MCSSNLHCNAWSCMYLYASRRRLQGGTPESAMAWCSSVLPIADERSVTKAGTHPGGTAVALVTHALAALATAIPSLPNPPFHSLDLPRRIVSSLFSPGASRSILSSSKSELAKAIFRPRKTGTPFLQAIKAPFKVSPALVLLASVTPAIKDGVQGHGSVLGGHDAAHRCVQHALD